MMHARNSGAALVGSAEVAAKLGRLPEVTGCSNAWSLVVEVPCACAGYATQQPLFRAKSAQLLPQRENHVREAQEVITRWADVDILEVLRF